MAGISVGNDRAGRRTVDHELPQREPAKTLHVKASRAGFELIWKRGNTVLDSERVARAPVEVQGEQRFPALTQAITKEWETRGEHRAVSDPALDRAVLHVQNDLPFSDVVAVLDALHAPRRGKLSAFDVAFAEN